MTFKWWKDHWSSHSWNTDFGSSLLMRQLSKRQLYDKNLQPTLTLLSLLLLNSSILNLKKKCYAKMCCTDWVTDRFFSTTDGQFFPKLHKYLETNTFSSLSAIEWQNLFQLIEVPPLFLIWSLLVCISLAQGECKVCRLCRWPSPARCMHNVNILTLSAPCNLFIASVTVSSRFSFHSSHTGL